jgi:hypothetical protein
MMVGPKNVIYRYKGNLKSDELEFDKSGKLWFTQGDFVSRHGKTWKIESLQEEFWVGEPERMPTLWVYLVSVSVN